MGSTTGQQIGVTAGSVEGETRLLTKKPSSDRVKLVTLEVSVGIFKGKIKPFVGTISGVGLTIPIGSSLGFLGDS